MPSILDKIKQFKRNTDPRLVLAVLIALIIFSSGSILWPPEPSALQTTPTPRAVQAELSALPTATPFPPEYLSNEQQTVGPSVAASILVLVVVFGVVGKLLSHKPD